jgi:hypothetical protein
MAGYYEFEFQLPEALLAQIVQRFTDADPDALVPENLKDIPDAQGVYQLMHQGQLVYIGKTDADAGLRKRLERHSRNVQHRLNIQPEDVQFKALRVFVFTAMDIESQLISHYGKEGSGWNGSGFGANDPGRERDTTTAKDGHFDLQFPLDLDKALTLELQLPASVGVALFKLKDAVPYTFRFETTGRRTAHEDLTNAVLDQLPEPLTMRTVLQAILGVVPPGWQATALPGRVILYKETRDYAHGEVIGKSD